jgi:indole-3-acetate monooxygenase
MSSHNEIITTAKSLRPLIIAARDQGEHRRRLPSHIVDSLAGAGLLQMYLPRSMGGPEVPYLTAFRAIEEISQADGSVGWCTAIATNLSLLMGWLPVAVGQQFSGQPANFRATGSIRPQGRAYVVGGGYRVEGRWDFASGIDHANRLYCTCLVMEDGKPQQTAQGTPRIRAAWLAPDQAMVEETWDTVGMRGTGSHDFIVNNAFVPAEHTCFIGDAPCETGPLYKSRRIMVTLNVTTVANALGIARGAIDALISLSDSGSPMSDVPLRDRHLVQSKLGEAEAILRSARAFAIDSFGSLWNAIETDIDLTHPIMQARLAIVHGMRESARAVDIVFHAAGTHAIHKRNPIERHFRDIHVAVQHNAGFLSQYENAGKVVMGGRPTEIGW